MDTEPGDEGPARGRSPAAFFPSSDNFQSPDLQVEVEESTGERISTKEVYKYTYAANIPCVFACDHLYYNSVGDLLYE